MSRGRGWDVVYRFEIALQCHRQIIEIFPVHILRFLFSRAFWSWVAKIWTSRKFPARRYHVNECEREIKDTLYFSILDQ